MTDHADNPGNKLVEVDWNDPKLRELLDKTAELRLDNRGTYKAHPVRLRRAWHDSAAAEDAMLVGDDGMGTYVLRTGLALERGEPVMIERERPMGGPPERVLGEVVDCTAGRRAEDHPGPVFIVRVQMHVTRR